MASSLTGAAKSFYKACINAPQNTLSQGDLLQKVKIANKDEITKAINLLLKKKLFTLMKDAKGIISYKAVKKAEAQIKGDMEGDEGLVYSHIEGAGNEGIWTKTLKSRTNLHQTVLNRCLKTLEQKQLVKVIKSVKFPTRKIYMLFNLQPSTDVSGGPWYTDHELDTEFIAQVSNAILLYIKDRSFPRNSQSPSQIPSLFPTSHTSKYPSVSQITTWLRKSKIAAVELGTDDIQSLLDVLVWEGEIESLPAFGGSGLESGDESGSEEDSDDEKRKGKKGKSKKRRRGSASQDESEDEDAKRKKKKRKAKDSDADENDDMQSEDDGLSSSSKRKKRKKPKKLRVGSDEDGDQIDSDEYQKTPSSSKHRSAPKSKTKKRRRDDPIDSDHLDSDLEGSPSASRPTKKRKKSAHSSDSDSSDSDSDSPPKKSRSSRQKDLSHLPFSSADVGGGLVYRAIRQERIGLGWSQAPCGRCPIFEFCMDGGPVNPAGCKYFDGWFGMGIGE